MESIIFALLWLILPPCEFEDSANCKWDAAQQGSRSGTSFVTIGPATFYED